MGLLDKWREKALILLIKQIPNLMKGSWRTTLVAWTTALGIILAQVTNLFDTDPATVFDYSQLLLAAGMIGIGSFARDNRVTSEEAHAGK